MRSLEEVYDRVQEIPFVAELKYDGQRAQIHASTDENGGVTIKIFSRHLEDMTDKVRHLILSCIVSVIVNKSCVNLVSRRRRAFSAHTPSRQGEKIDVLHTRQRNRCH